MKDEGGETCKQEGELSLDQKEPIAKITEAKKSRKTKANAEDKQETQAPIKKAKETPNDIIKSTATASDQVGKAQTCAHQAADNKEKADDGGKKNAAKDNAAKAKAAKSKAAKSKPGKAVAKEREPVPAAESSEKGAASKKDAKLDVWWSDEMGKALLRVSGQGESTPSSTALRSGACHTFCLRIWRSSMQDRRCPKAMWQSRQKLLLRSARP